MGKVKKTSARWSFDRRSRRILGEKQNAFVSFFCLRRSTNKYPKKKTVRKLITEFKM